MGNRFNRIAVVLASFILMPLIVAMDNVNSDVEGLKLAIKRGNFERVEALLNKGCDPNALDATFHKPPLYFAAERGDVVIAKLLLRFGADPGIQVFEWRQAAPFRKAGIIKGKPSDGPLHEAAKLGKIHIIELLLDEGAGVDVPGDRDKTPLHYAVMKCQPEAVRLLLQRRADVNKCDQRGYSPLYLLLNSMDPQCGKKEIVQLLLQAGADVNSVWQYGMTLLHEAVIDGDEGVVDELVQAGAKMDAKEMHGNMPLHLAAWVGHKDVVDILLEKGADLYARNSLGYTPMHYAADENRPEALRVLLDEVTKRDGLSNERMDFVVRGMPDKRHRTVAMLAKGKPGVLKVIEEKLMEPTRALEDRFRLQLEAEEREGWKRIQERAKIKEQERRRLQIEAQEAAGITPEHAEAFGYMP